MGISQRELAELCGCSSSFISQIELRQTSPSLDSLARICEGLGMNVIQFLSKKAEDINALVVREYEPRQFLCTWESASIEFLMPAEAAAALTVLRLRVQPKGKTALRGARRSMHEIGHVVQGKCSLRLADKSVRLAAGDTVRLDLSTPHQWINTGDSLLEVILINPNFTDVFDITTVPDAVA